MIYKIHHQFLKFKNPFVLAHGTRLGTDALHLEVRHNNHVFWSEAVFPPYLKDTFETTSNDIEDFFNQNLKSNLSELHASVASWQGNTSSKCVLDCLFLQITAKESQSDIREYLKIPEKQIPLTLTFSKSDWSNNLDNKKSLSKHFTHIKLKWTGAEDDVEFTNAIYKKIGMPICIDANQGYKSKEQLLKAYGQVEKLPVKLIEQPFEKDNIELHFQLKRSLDVPIFADESIQHLADYLMHYDAFHGINVKLLKCGGITPALALIQAAKSNNQQVLIGCMAESSLGMTLSAVLAPLCDMADLDAPYLIMNDNFNGAYIQNRILTLNEISIKATST